MTQMEAQHFIGTTGTFTSGPEYAQTARDMYKGREITVYGQNACTFDGLTTNKLDYVRHPLEARPHVGPAQYSGHSLPFDGTTTYSSEFVGHALEPRHGPPAHVYQPSAAPFDGQTTYKTNYVPHQVEPAGPMGPQARERVNLPFEGVTSYRSEFVPHQLPERAMAPGGPYNKPHVPFEAGTTYKGDFTAHQLERRPAPPNAAGQLRPSLPFDGSTTYGEYFRPFPVQPHAVSGARQGQYKLSDAKFEGCSETMDKFRAWAIDPSNRRGGGPPPMHPSLPFDGTTTHREMFQGWQLPPKRPALGVQMVGDIAYVLIPANAPIPAVGRQIFTTVHDNQNEMRVLVLEGDFSQASRCNVLGHFDICGLPPGPKGSVKIEISFHVDANGVMNATARDMNTQRQEQWLREGLLVAHVNNQA